MIAVRKSSPATGRNHRKGRVNVMVLLYEAEVHCGDRLHHADHVVCARLWVDGVYKKQNENGTTWK